MGYEGYLDAERNSLRKAVVAKAFSNASDKFKSLREARVKNEREAMKFDLDMRAKKAELAALENDPMADPALVSMQKRNLKLGFDAQKAQLERMGGYTDEAYRQTAGQMQQLGQVAAKMNQATMQAPEVFGDMMIEPDLKTGRVTLKPMKGANSSSLEATKIRDKREREMKALEIANDPFTGVFDESKYRQALKLLGVAGDESQQVDTEMEQSEDQDGDGIPDLPSRDELQAGKIYKAKGKKYKYAGRVNGVDQFEPQD